MSYPQVISLINLKGGVGKTTLCVNLAYGLSYFHNYRVLIVDLDPQANATQYLISQQAYRKVYLGDDPSKSTVFELYKAREANIGVKKAKLIDSDRYLQRVYTGSSGYLDLVASKLDLSLVAFMSGLTQQNDQIRWLIENVANRYDYVFIDCPPTVSRMLIGAFEASTSFLVPVKPEFLSTLGLPLLDNVIKDIYMGNLDRRPDWMEPSLVPLGIVYTMVSDHLTMTQQSIRDLGAMAERLKYPIFDSKISASTKFAWSSQHALPVFRSEPRSKYAEQIQAVVSEFIERTG